MKKRHWLWLLMALTGILGGLVAFRAMSAFRPPNATVISHASGVTSFRVAAPTGAEAAKLHDWAVDLAGPQGYTVGPGLFHTSGVHGTVTITGTLIHAKNTNFPPGVYVVQFKEAPLSLETVWYRIRKGIGL